MCVSTAKARTKWASRFARFQRSRFTSAPCSFFELCHFVWQAWDFWDILRSGMSFCVTGAGHRSLFHPRGRRGTFGTLLKRQNERWFWRSFCVAGTVFGELGRRFERVESLVFVKLSSFVFDFGHDDDSVWQMRHFGCPGLIFMAGAVFCRPRQKSCWDFSKTFVMFFFCGARHVSWISKVCSRNPLLTLCVSDCSRCGAVGILI